MALPVCCCTPSCSNLEWQILLRLVRGSPLPSAALFLPVAARALGLSYQLLRLATVWTEAARQHRNCLRPPSFLDISSVWTFLSAGTTRTNGLATVGCRHLPKSTSGAPPVQPPLNPRHAGKTRPCRPQALWTARLAYCIGTAASMGCVCSLLRMRACPPIRARVGFPAHSLQDSQHSQDARRPLP